MLENVYFVCAAAGGAVLVLQTIGSLIGGGHAASDSDFGPDDLHAPAHGAGHVDGDAFVKLFTFKSIVAFLTFFGLSGLASERAGLPDAGALAISLLAGAAALFGVAWLMKALAKLQSRGNLRLEHAIGLHGKVYLRVPPRGEGIGKVTLAMQGRTVELKAISLGPELPTGAPVRVVALHADDTIEVAGLTA